MSNIWWNNTTKRDQTVKINTEAIPPPPPKRKSSVLYIVTVIVLLAIIAGGILYVASNYAYLKTVLVRKVPTAAPTATPVPLTMVDWNNFTYHTKSICGTFTLHNGSAVTQTPYASYWIVANPIYGDLTGHGAINAVILYSCGFGAGEPGPFALVYAGSAIHPKLLAELALQNGNPYGGRINTVDILAGGILQLTGSGWAIGDSHCCPSLFVTTDYRWDGTSFVVIRSDSIVLTPTPTPVPPPTPPPAFSTVSDVYTAFISAGIAMGNAGSLPNSWWSCCSYYPGKGAIDFIDSASGGTMVIALFNASSAATTDAVQAHSSQGWGYYTWGTCLLLYNSARTNLTPYEQVMQADCQQ